MGRSFCAIRRCTGFFKRFGKRLNLRRAGKRHISGGEFGYCLRGCYSSVQKFKGVYRQAEAIITAAEATQGLIASRLGGKGVSLAEAWEAILFNSFHDILPGSSIERAMEEQTAWVGLAIHHSHKARFEALNRLAAEIDTRAPKPTSPNAPTAVPILLWNPLPREFSGPVELEASLDYRPLYDYENRPDEVPVALRDENGRALPFQEIATEHSSMPTQPWRKRIVAHLTIPPMGWKVVRLGLAKVKQAQRADKYACRARAGSKPSISNSRWQITCNRTLTIKHDGRNFFPGGKKLSLLVVEDPWGSWGGMNEEPESYCLERVREEWKLSASEILEKGPERSRLWTRWQGKQSWVDLTFDLCRDQPWITVHGRLLWNERSARLQLVLPSVGPAVCDVPGSVVVRETRGQVPVGRWFHRENGQGRRIGVASDGLSDADFLPKETRLTLARASRYANDAPTAPNEKPWQPAVDCGEFKFRLSLFADGVEPDHVADSLLYPPSTLPVTPAPGALAGTGSLGKLMPDTVRLLSVKLDERGGIELRVQNRGRQPVNPKFYLGKSAHSLGRIGAQQIQTAVIPAAENRRS